MKATIIDIMESWPLQLKLQTPTGQEQVMLDENVRIYHAGLLVDPNKLRPGQHVQVLTRSISHNKRISEIEICE
jgi:hypothetical protein